MSTPTPQRGTDYVARVDLFNAAGDLVAAAGASCTTVDPVSLPWLLAQGLIVPASPAPADAEETS